MTTTAYREAIRAAYLAGAPEPAPLDEQCPTCHAQPGGQCQRKGKEVATHNTRTTRAAREAGRRRAEADLAARAAGTIHAALTQGEPIERITDMVSRQHSLAAAAYLAAQGWRPVNHSTDPRWRSPSDGDQEQYTSADALRAAIAAAARP